jgi:hypothetical protein
MKSIFILLFAILTIVFIRKILMKFPNHYFTIQDIVTKDPNELKLRGFFLRFIPILLFSLFIAFICKGSIEYIVVYSIFVSFLLIWPFILNEIIYRNKNEEQYSSVNKLSKRQVINYLIFYFMYSILCINVSLLAIPIYNLINQIPIISNINPYNSFLKMYLTLDPFLQALIPNIVVFIIGTLSLCLFRRISSWWTKKIK